ncbi:dioxygenase family protein [Imbroritus primus]|uniref:dioxygenase family protein n=1 Tax=Imbroritus primus TaxID=3058603 RepID=UPI003D160E83
MATSLLPTLYISHGSPMLALDPGATGAALDALGARLRQMPPRAILVISAHWSYSTLAVTTRVRQEAWHDFGGFAPQLFALRYDAPGAPVVAQRVRALLSEAAIDGASYVAEDPDRPLDHGAWMPLRYLFPDADVPVLQLALNPCLPPATQIEIGRALAPLRGEGVLIIGSGSFTHNLHEVFSGTRAQHGPAPLPYVEAFRTWMLTAIDEALASGDFSTLARYRTLAPEAQRAHPTDEHLLPLYVALGAAVGPQAAAAPQGKGATCERIVDEVTYGVLAMDTLLFHGGVPALAQAA